MKKLNQWLRNYFGFSKTESNGFVILIPLIILIVFSPFLLRHAFKSEFKISESDLLQLDSLVDVLESQIDSQQQEKSDKFRKYDYSDKYDKQRELNKDNLISESDEDKLPGKPRYPKPKLELKPFDLNDADTTQLKKIYGIGPVLSVRILKYRDLLGGFNSKEQLREVYGLDAETLAKLDSLTFISTDFKPSMVAINDLKAYQLDDHPYISKKMAKAIDAYRFQHGRIDSLEVLYNIQIIDSTAIQKIAPYLKF